MRWSPVVVIVAASVASVNGQDPPEVWRRHLAERLAAAAFGRKTFEAYDLIMYQTALYPPRSEKEIRKIVTDMYDRTDDVGAHKKGTPEREAEIEAEVQRILTEQRENRPQRRWRRVRVAGESIRVDETILKPDEEFKPDMRVQDTYILAKGEYIRYHHVPGSASAWIARATGRESVPWNSKELEEWCLPPVVRTFAWMELGRWEKTGQGKRQAVLDPAKIDSFAKNGPSFHGMLRLSTEMGPGGRAIDRVEKALAAPI